VPIGQKWQAGTNPYFDPTIALLLLIARQRTENYSELAKRATSSYENRFSPTISGLATNPDHVAFITSSAVNNRGLRRFAVSQTISTLRQAFTDKTGLATGFRMRHVLICTHWSRRCLVRMSFPLVLLDESFVFPNRKFHGKGL